MGLKRKRSMDDSPVSTSSFAASTPEAQSPTPIPHQFDGAMDLDISSHFSLGRWWESRPGRLSSSDVGSRTRKRFRDNRPDERVIHENTINKLFSAQRNYPHAQPILSDSAQLAPQHAPAVQKSTLHAFWKLPAPPVQSHTIQIRHHQVAPQTWDPPRCDDCDGVLQSETNEMEIDMELDECGSSNTFACRDCGKNVCGMCAVVSNTRHCLQCATTSRNSGRWW
ncbi:uncharacterized protein BDR25DRAFT_252819 [Lindgomyces ingoldianus]|uniref:Uncharacterized protein n=1 Tax=Lindgomyces ingoldianus TaxID=673940 RepID=A0ACB6RDV2_9PLEO|nr:uncharacterized protein BDR25DRAFT_252819 [Lindgomyces ingoldianus]KAF2476661.1 hypothetical protein BDR25DRAFT_252819 [Lindgomyces ingoldianus]